MPFGPGIEHGPGLVEMPRPPRREPVIIEPIIAIMRRWLDGEPVWPYARIIEEWGAEFEMYRKRWRRDLSFSDRSIDRTADLYRTRDAWIKSFGFAIPCAELLDLLECFPSVIEVGAGTGYMTRLMRNRGIKVVGSDAVEERHFAFKHGVYDHQQVNAQGKTMVRRYRDSLVFCSWPSLDQTWFRQMLRAMQIGQPIVVIREDCCAEDSAWDYIDECFEEEARIDIPAFDFMNDYAAAYVKKRRRPRK